MKELKDMSEWKPYYHDVSRILYPKYCAVCGYESNYYLTNTYYCDRHFHSAMCRDLIVHNMIKDAIENYGHANHLFDKQPDLHCHAKWIREAEGLSQPKNWMKVWHGPHHTRD